MRDYQRIYNVMDEKKVIFKGDYKEISNRLGIRPKMVHNYALSGSKYRYKYSIKEVGERRKYYRLKSKDTGWIIEGYIEDICDKLLVDRNYIYETMRFKRLILGEWAYKVSIKEVLYDR